MGLRFENIDSASCNSGTFPSDQGQFFAPHFTCSGRLPDPALDPGYSPVSIVGTTLEVLPSTYLVYVNRSGAIGNVSSFDVVPVKATVTATTTQAFSGDGALIMRIPQSSVQIGGVTSDNGNTEGYIDFVSGATDETAVQTNIATDGFAVMAYVISGAVVQGDMANICTKGTNINTNGGDLKTGGGILDLGGSNIQNIGTTLDDSSLITRGDVEELIEESQGQSIFDSICLNNFTDSLSDPTTAPTAVESVSGNPENGVWAFAYSYKGGAGETLLSPEVLVDIDLNHTVSLGFPSAASVGADEVYIYAKYTLGDNIWRRYAVITNTSETVYLFDHGEDGVYSPVSLYSGSFDVPFFPLYDNDVPVIVSGSVGKNVLPTSGFPQGFVINGPYNDTLTKYVEFKLRVIYKDDEGNYTRSSVDNILQTVPVTGGCAGISNSCDGFYLKDIVIDSPPGGRNYTDAVLLIEYASKYSAGPNIGSIHSGPNVNILEVSLNSSGTTTIPYINYLTSTGTQQPTSVPPQVTSDITSFNYYQLLSFFYGENTVNNTSKISCIENQMNGNYRVVFSTGAISGAIANEQLGTSGIYLSVINGNGL